jgi:hypothetical protein
MGSRRSRKPLQLGPGEHSSLFSANKTNSTSIEKLSLSWLGWLWWSIVPWDHRSRPMPSRLYVTISTSLHLTQEFYPYRHTWLDILLDRWLSDRFLKLMGAKPSWLGHSLSLPYLPWLVHSHQPGIPSSFSDLSVEFVQVPRLLLLAASMRTYTKILSPEVEHYLSSQE